MAWSLHGNIRRLHLFSNVELEAFGWEWRRWTYKETSRWSFFSNRLCNTMRMSCHISSTGRDGASISGAGLSMLIDTLWHQARKITLHNTRCFLFHHTPRCVIQPVSSSHMFYAAPDRCRVTQQTLIFIHWFNPFQRVHMSNRRSVHLSRGPAVCMGATAHRFLMTLNFVVLAHME